MKNEKYAVWGRFAKKNGTGGLTEHQNGNETDGSIYHGAKT